MKVKLLLILTAITLATISPAPIKDLRRDVKIEPEKTQAQVQEDQRNHQQVQAEMAAPPADTDYQYTNPEDNGKSDGKKALVANENQQADDKQAKQALGVAAKDIKTGPERNNSWIWALLLGVLGFGGVYAFRHFAGRMLPEPPPSVTGEKTSKKDAKW